MAALTLLTLGAAFWAVALAFNRGQERQLDEALLVEAARAAENAVTPSGAYAVADGSCAEVGHAGPMPVYGAVFDEQGALRAVTSNLAGDPPAPASSGSPFDLAHAGLRLRAVTVPVPRRTGASLLLAVPRTDLDGDAAFLGQAMLSVFAVACVWSLLVAVWLIYHLTREQEAIADVVLRVASGDLGARVRSQSTDPEIRRLASAVDTMISRLVLLLESQKRFVAHAAHELRAPLTLVLGQLVLALRRPRSAAEYREAIREVLDAAAGLRSLTEELLDLARAGGGSAGPFAPTSVARAARGAVRYVLADAARAGIGIDLALRDVLVAARSGDLERLVRNLVENAVRHSPRGGRVRVEAEDRGGTLEIAVSDEGSGVPLGERDRLFEPFFRGAEAHGSKGAGLGLSIVREIARTHGGDVHLDPTPPRGARFVVRLPVFHPTTDEQGCQGAAFATLRPS
jgi:two-component system heavy metal sensor histidine kinase CusS